MDVKIRLMELYTDSFFFDYTDHIAIIIVLPAKDLSTFFLQINSLHLYSSNLTIAFLHP